MTSVTMYLFIWLLDFLIICRNIFIFLIVFMSAFIDNITMSFPYFIIYSIEILIHILLISYFISIIIIICIWIRFYLIFITSWLINAGSKVKRILWNNCHEFSWRTFALITINFFITLLSFSFCIIILNSYIIWLSRLCILHFDIIYFIGCISRILSTSPKEIGAQKNQNDKNKRIKNLIIFYLILNIIII